MERRKDGNKEKWRDGKTERHKDGKTEGSKIEKHTDRRTETNTDKKPNYLSKLLFGFFKIIGQLKSHVLHRHVGVKLSKNHLCTECGASFVKPHDLGVHMLRHTG